VFDMTEDLPTTNINAEEKVMTIEPSTAGCVIEASGKQVQVGDSGNCALQRIATMAEHDEEEDDELSASNWEGVTVKDFDRLYRLLRSLYKDFHKRHRSSEHTIQGLEGEIKSLRSCIEQLEGEIEELKVLAKTEEVQVLEANMHVLERQLDFERGQWTKLQGKYKELMDRFFVLDHWEGVSLANAVQKKLDKHSDEQFHQGVSMEVTKRVSGIMEDPELQKKLAYINVDEEYNNCVSKEAMKRFKDMEECLMLSRDPNVEITPS
jgi:predicted RNase H-like nuclease (RuvC/YqgF family)